MPKIHRLSQEEAQKIAAGEVVERPANVVKELLENSIDAEATDITLYIEDGGKELIRIVDNGTGMSKEDAYLCIEHHATSKLRSVNDLSHLKTFGFRGEALSSISSVSTMVLVTKDESSPAALSLRIEGGTIKEEKLAALARGTDISIRNLFYNVPARAKFLKSKETEWRAIIQLFQAIALAHPQISFKLFHNDRLLYAAPRADTIQERLDQVFEPAQKNTILVSEHTDTSTGLKVVAAFTSPDYTRFDRSQIFCFVNTRWVKNFKLGQALIKGFQGMLQPQRYPAGALFITIDPNEVDINIHPRKEEVQFLHPRIVTDLIEQLVKETLESAQEALFTPALSIPSLRRDFKSTLSLEQTPLPKFINATPLTEVATPISATSQDAFVKAVAPYFEEEKTAPTPLNFIPELQYRLLGQVHMTYIVAEIESSIVYIDQHAAHERIVYERLKAQFDEVVRVRLLFPQVIPLTRGDLDLLEPHLPLLESFGIGAQRSGDAEIVIHETPLFAKNHSLGDCIKQAIAALHEYSYLSEDELKKSIREKIHAHISCKTAIKAGDKLTDEMMHSLIGELYTCEHKLTCPHGRPTLWEMKQSELEKKFKRDYRS